MWVYHCYFLCFVFVVLSFAFVVLSCVFVVMMTTTMIIPTMTIAMMMIWLWWFRWKRLLFCWWWRCRWWQCVWYLVISMMLTISHTEFKDHCYSITKYAPTRTKNGCMRPISVTYRNIYELRFYIDMSYFTNR